MSNLNTDVKTGKGEFGTRRFLHVRLHDLTIRGTGITGKWIMRLDAEEQCTNHTARAAFVIEFLPASVRYCRVSMIGEAATDAANGTDALLPVPDDLQTAFDDYVRRECARRRLPLRRTKQGPKYLLCQLATLLVGQQTQPSEAIRQEVERYIGSHFLERPEFVKRVVQSDRVYHFGDPLVGRFFMTEIPPCHKIN